MELGGFLWGWGIDRVLSMVRLPIEEAERMIQLFSSLVVALEKQSGIAAAFSDVLTNTIMSVTVLL